jgi:fatty-acyl-CoA synthase
MGYFADLPRIASLADIEAIERTPFAARGVPGDTYAILREAAGRYGEAPALTFLPQGDPDETPVRLGYRAFFARITAAANLFHGLGVRPDAPVAYVLPNLPETHEVIWGGEAAGAVCAVNPLLEPAHVVEILKAARAKVLVTLGPFPGSDLWAKCARIAGDVPGLAAVLQIDLGRYFEAGWAPAAPQPARIGGAAVISYEAALARQPSDRLVSERRIAPADIASYFHTGGTTGAPKIAPHTHANEAFMAWLLPALLGTRPGDVFLCGLPLFHVNAVMVTGLGNWIAGAEVLLAGIQGYRSPKLLPGFWKLVEKYRVTYFSAVPTIYSALLDVPVAGADVSSLRYAICGAAPMPPEVFRRFEALTGVRILEGYGLTEGTTASVLNPPAGERRIGAIGLRMPYQQVKVAMLDQRGRIARDAAPGEVGVVVMRGPHVFPGYLAVRDDEGAWALDAAGERWLNTGDLARQDREGYLWLAGRAKDLIIRGGHNIDPQLIEEAMCRHPAVAIAAAVGEPDAHAGELPICFVVLREGAAAGAEELLDFARREVPERAAVPVRVVVLPQMPVTAVGKIFKPTLRHRAIEKVYGAALAAAGVAARVSVAPDPARGALARVALADPAQNALAEQTLARYTVPYEIH